MAKEYTVILIEDEDSCAIKKVSENSFYQIRDMLGDSEDDLTIIDSIVELDTTEDNIISNGLTREEAEEYAKEISDDYIILEAF